MQDRHFKKYPPLNLNSSNQIQSSQLYSLNPIGIGTPLVESLTSYIARLSLAHCVYPGILMERVVKSAIDKKLSSADIHKIYNFTGSINGTGVMGLDLVDALEKLTFQNHLALLTLTNLSELIPSRKLLHKYKFWCPQCYGSWRTDNQEIYEPLLWKLKTVTVCDVHNLPLQEYCPHCQKKNYHLAWKTRSGYCSQCGQWLGEFKKYNITSLNKERDTEFNWYFWVTKNLGELLAKNSSCEISLGKEIVSKSLLKYAQQNTDGNIAALARQLKMPKNTVWLWCKRKNQPSLEMLLRICYCLEVSVWNFLTQENLVTSENVSFIGAPPQLKPKAKSKILDHDKVRQYLEQVLKRDDKPPPSMEKVAKELQFHLRTISRHFPELCREISAKYSQYKKNIHRKAVQESCQEVRQAVKKLYREGKYPSESQVAKVISRPGFLRYKKVRSALRKAKQELNLGT